MKRSTVKERRAYCQQHGHSWIKVWYSSHRRCSWCEEYEEEGASMSVLHVTPARLLPEEE